MGLRVTMMLGRIALLCAALAGCHENSAAMDPADAGGPPDMTFPRAASPVLPQVPTAGGPILAHMKLVTISIEGDATEAGVIAFADWVVKSQWLSTVGAEYGVGTGTHVHATWPSLPSMTNTLVLPDQIRAAIDAGKLPPVDDNTLYMIYVPSSTTLTDWPTSTCGSHGGTYTPAFHASTFGAGARFAYAVVPTCAALQQQGLEQASAHELIEGATDPLGTTNPTFIFESNDPWYQTGGELADICNQTIQVDGHYVTQVWSNAAAASSYAPCIPATTPYYTVSPSPETATIHPGETAKFLITGWSSAAVDPWNVLAIRGLYSPPVSIGLDEAKLGNGDVGHLSITAPADATPGRTLTVLIYSSMGTGEYARPISVDVN